MEQITAMTTKSLHQIVNGMAYALGHKWADRQARLIAGMELDRRENYRRFG